jgi:hypothetical protein
MIADSGWAKIHLAMSPGNANLPIGVAQSANREIGVPGFQSIRYVPNVR